VNKMVKSSKKRKNRIRFLISTSVLIARVTNKTIFLESRELGHFQSHLFVFFIMILGAKKFYLILESVIIKYALKVHTKFEVNQLSRS
jgi:NADH:ubiquinone oxidoreductase subunit K